MINYFIGGRDGKPQGPYSLQDLRAMALKSEIDAETMVIEEGASSWGRYRDLRSAERTQEVAEVLAEKAAKVAAAFQRKESRSFVFGLLLGIVHLLTLPWQLIRASARTVSEWGASRFIPMSEERLALAALGKVGKPLVILMWTAVWVGDCFGLLFLGKPVITMHIASAFTSFLLLGTPGSGAMDIVDFAANNFRIRELGDRLVWMLKAGILGYISTIFFALAGEIIMALSGLKRHGESQSAKVE